jgi:hypothetical protein
VEDKKRTWSRSDNNRRREERDREFVTVKVAATTAIKIFTKKAGNIITATTIIVEHSAKRKILGERNTEDLGDIAILLLHQRELTIPLRGSLTQGQRNILQATGTSLSILFRLNQNARWCLEFEKQNLRFQDKEMCL